jgi:hypothetical protein
VWVLDYKLGAPKVGNPLSAEADAELTHSEDAARYRVQMQEYRGDANGICRQDSVLRVDICRWLDEHGHVGDVWRELPRISCSIQT